MSIIKMPYNSTKVSMVRQLLFNNKEAGKPTDYEIHVDDLKVVPRTNNPELFDDHDQFVDGDTKSLTIVLYDGNSRRCNKHIFELIEPKPLEPGLSGVEVQAKIQESLDQQKQKWEQDKLKEDKEDLENKLKEAKQKIEGLEEQLQEYRDGIKGNEVNYGNILSIALQSWMVGNKKKILARMPGLAGFIGDEPGNESSNITSGEEPVMTFREKDPSEVSLTEDQKAAINFVVQLNRAFPGDEFRQVIDVLNGFIDNKSAIGVVLNYLAKAKAARQNPPDKGSPEATSKANNESKPPIAA